MVRRSTEAVSFWPLAAVIAFGLTACTTGRGDPVPGAAGTGTAPDAQAAVATDFFKSDYCPPVEIRPGTEALTVYERGHENEPAYVRYQASIMRTARECRLVGGVLTMKVGVGGRIVAGPKGTGGTHNLPVRVAVVKQIGGTGPLYSQKFEIPVSVSAPTFGANYDHVFEQVSAQVGPDDRNLIILVGFDEG